MAVNAEALSPGLGVDFEGALVRSDLLLESLLAFVKRNAFYLFLAAYWLLRYGREGLKTRLVARGSLNPATLPYNKELLARLKEERARGRCLWLYTSEYEQLATAVARHLDLFDGVITGGRQVELEWYGSEWRPKGKRMHATVRALRPYQWTKNVLVLVPLLAAHQMGDLDALAAGLLAVIAFCLCASSVYVLNDMLDLEADRAHVRKAKRPFASGDLPLATGFILTAALLAGAAVIAAFLPEKFQFSLAAYYLLTAAYSFTLKRMLLIDTVALAGLYTLRVIAGAEAVSVALSFWLLLFSVFMFLSLAFVKRYAELESLRRQQRLQAIGRGYHVEDLSVLQSLGTAAGYLSVLVLALYINSPDIQSLYHRPKVIWMLCVLVLYWISRIWMTAQRGRMHDDPVVYALKDRVSLLLGLVAAITIAIAI